MECGGVRLKTRTLFDIGTLYTVGYAHPDTAAQVDRLMHQEQTVLLDIRLSPRSRWHPAWNQHPLASIYGDRYLWERRLGNLNYKHPELVIQLAQGYEDAAREAAKHLLQGTSLILLCACKYERKKYGKRLKVCHRSLVAKLIQDAVQALQESEVQI
jgi:Protein of unknown function, DUF488